MNLMALIMKIVLNSLQVGREVCSVLFDVFGVILNQLAVEAGATATDSTFYKNYESLSLLKPCKVASTRQTQSRSSLRLGV